MKKRFLPFLLTAAMLTAALPAASAAPATQEDVAQVLAALDIMTGNENGDLMLSRRVTRAEFTKLAVAASPMGESVGATTSVSPYPDVPYTSWEAPYVEAAVAAGLVKGNLYGCFEPGRDITLQEGVTIVVRLLGYTDADFSGAWPSGQMTLYRNLDLDEGIACGDTSPMTRQDAMHLFYNLLTAQTKQGQTYLNLLGHGLTPAGEIDRVALINAAMDGPVVMKSGWQGSVGFDVSTAKVYRDGKAASQSSLQVNDVIYWSKSMRTLWAYSNKVTGLYQAVSPSASSPSAVTVAGKTYAIETAGAAYALSNIGQYRVGDTVTLLLGRDGGVAAVAEPAAVNGTVYGVVSAVADLPYTDASGNSYTGKSVVVSATDGNSYSFPVEAASSWKAGNLVKAAGDKVEKLTQSSVSGKVAADGGKIGSTVLSPTAEIIDVNSGGASVKLYPSRLAGMKLESGDVKFCLKNAAGEIEKLILNDATGDLCAYGVLTSVTETASSSMFMAMGTYQYDVGGQTYGFMKQNGVFNVEKGPVQIEGPLTAPEAFNTLKSAKLASLDALTAVFSDGKSFPVWENAAVYELEDKDYRLSSLERVRSGYALTAYYDKSAEEGGRIRVVVAKPL